MLIGDYIKENEYTSDLRLKILPGHLVRWFTSPLPTSDSVYHTEKFNGLANRLFVTWNGETHKFITWEDIIKFNGDDRELKIGPLVVSRYGPYSNIRILKELIFLRVLHEITCKKCESLCNTPNCTECINKLNQNVQLISDYLYTEVGPEHFFIFHGPCYEIFIIIAHNKYLTDKFIIPIDMKNKIRISDGYRDMCYIPYTTANDTIVIYIQHYDFRNKRKVSIKIQETLINDVESLLEAAVNNAILFTTHFSVYKKTNYFITKAQVLSLVKNKENKQDIDIPTLIEIQWKYLSTRQTELVGFPFLSYTLSDDGLKGINTDFLTPESRKEYRKVMGSRTKDFFVVPVPDVLAKQMLRHALRQREEYPLLYRGNYNYKLVSHVKNEKGEIDKFPFIAIRPRTLWKHWFSYMPDPLKSTQFESFKRFWRFFIRPEKLLKCESWRAVFVHEPEKFGDIHELEEEDDNVLKRQKRRFNIGD